MRRRAKASSAGSNTSRGKGLGSASRGALATRAASSAADGSGAPTDRAVRKLSLLGLSLLLCSLILVAGAHASHKLVYFSFGSQGAAGGQLNRVSGVAVNASGAGVAGTGDLYLADVQNHRIQQFDAKGNLIRAFGQDVIVNTGTPANSNGTGYEVCDTTTNPPNTAAECKAGITSAASGGAMNLPLSVAVDQSDGSLYVFDGGNRRIQKFGAGGNFLWASGKDVITGGTTTGEVCTLAAQCKAGPSFTVPPVSGPLPGGEFGSSYNSASAVQLAVAPDQSVYVTDTNGRRVQQLSSAGAFVRTFGAGVVEGGATGTGTVTAGSAQITGVVTTSKFFAVEQTIAGAGIPAGTRILSVANGGIVNLSQAATASAPGVALTAAAGAGNNPRNEVQTVTIGAGVTSGNFKLRFTTPAPGNTDNATANIPFNASPAEVDASLEALASIGAANVSVSSPNPGGGAAPGGPYTVEFDGPRYADANVNQLSTTVAGVPPLNVAGSAGLAVATTREGTSAFEVCTAAPECGVGPASTELGQFASGTPNSIAVDSSGAIYTVEARANSRVQKFTPQAGPPQLAAQLFAPSIVGDTAGGAAPTYVAIGTGDDVYVDKRFPFGAGTPPATVGERRVLQLNSSGSELLHTHLVGAGIGSGGTGVSDRGGLALDPLADRLYLSTHTETGSNSRVHVVTDPPDKAPVLATGLTGPGATAQLRTLEGTVNPSGFRLTECRFAYGTTTAYGSSTACVPTAVGVGDGSSPVAVSASTAPLEPGTTYHYRLLASNAGLSGQGKDRTFTTAPTPAEGCANADVRAEQGIGVLLLPDCMALEQISPAHKGNQQATRPAALTASGDQVLFNASATLGECPTVDVVGGDPFLARRDAGGWQVECVNSPYPKQLEAGVRFASDTNSNSPGGFAPDLSSWFRFGRRDSDGLGQYFRVGVDGQIAPLSAPFQSLIDLPIAPVFFPHFLGNPADHSKLYFRPPVIGDRYSVDDPLPAGPGRDYNAYIAELDQNGNPSTTLFAEDRDGKVWGGNCGVRFGGMTGAGLAGGKRNQGAISSDGSRVYFSTSPAQPEAGDCSEANKKRIMERLETSSGPEVKELIASECDRVAPPCAGHDGNDLYQGASVDGSKVYFTTNRQLADTDLDGSATPCPDTGTLPFGFNATAGCDLYLYDRAKPAGERLTQVSAGEATAPTPGEGANVPSAIAAISADGSHVYFAAAGILTTDPSPTGALASEGGRNFYAWDAETGDTAFIGTLGATDGGFGAPAGAGLWGSLGGTWENAAYPVPIEGRDGQGKEVGGDGHVLVFNSVAPLTAEDGDGSILDIFRYDAESHQLERVSKAGPGGSDNGPLPASIQFSSGLGSDYVFNRRGVSEDGETVVFQTDEALLPGDLNGLRDAYMQRGAGTYRLPGSTLVEGLHPGGIPVVSADGSAVAYQSLEQLVASDGDTAADVYVARVGGGFRGPVDASCQGEACQGAPGTLSGEIGANSGSFAGAGNVAADPKAKPRRCPKGKRKVRRAGKSRCVARTQRHGRPAGAGRRAGR